jgi:bifunctional pyridoxal-dependent enzyme with beta-cystathionase and maltose regulon repressor activities
MSKDRDHYFAQRVMMSPKFREGALTAKAKAHNMTALEYARAVLMNPAHHDVQTRRQAQFLVNIQRQG